MSAIRLAVSRWLELVRGFGMTDPGELLQAGRVSVWVRWFGLACCLAEVNYRVEYGALSHILNNFYVLGFMAVNGYVHYLIHRTGQAKPVWLLGLSVMDLAGISFSTSLSGGFSSPYFPLYFFMVAMFAWVFSAPRHALAWTTLVVVVYVTLCVSVEPGLDIAEKEERGLFYRVVALYLVSGAVCLVTGFERSRRIKGLDRERELHRQRTELSQTIHDNSAQWAYMTGLGIQGAMEVADKSNDALMARLRVAADLARSAMWELRHPIDGGQIFRGEDLGLVLETHAATFTTISSVPAELVQEGADPPMSTINRSLLFSIAHNALTNVMRHAQANRVVIDLDYSDGQVRLSVSDDGIGLPPDYEAKGHGFRNMRADARRMGGELEVQSNGEGCGTTVTCVVPHEAATGEE